MRFVKGLDEQYYKQMILEIDRKFQDLHKKLNLYCSGVSLFPTSIMKNGIEYPYPLAAEIREIYLYMIGKTEPPDDIVMTLERICELIWDNPFLNESSYTIDWLKWERTLIGRFVRCTYIKLALDADESITAKQLGLMVGFTNAGVIRAITSGRLHATKVGNEWAIPARDAIRFIHEHV